MKKTSSKHKHNAYRHPLPLALPLALILALLLALPLPAASRSRDRDEIAIIYGGNSQRVLLPFPPSADALGGLSRYAAVVSSLRQAHGGRCRGGGSVAIDAGNMVGANSDPLRFMLAAAYYGHMNFDVIAPGGGELAAGLPAFMAFQDSAARIVVSGTGERASGVSDYLVVSAGGRRTRNNVFVVNILGASVASGSASDIGALKKLLASPAAVNARLRVAVVHGSMREIRRAAAALPRLDVIIAGSLDVRLREPLTIGNTLVVSAGSENKFAGRLLVRFEKGGRTIISAHNTLFPVYQSIRPDPGVDALLRRVSAGVLAARTRSKYRPVRMRGVIPFISTRGGAERVFLKVVETRREYTLSGEADTHPRGTVLTSGGNRAAFIYGDPRERNGRLKVVNLAVMESASILPNMNVIEAVFSPVDDFLYVIAADSGSEVGGIYMTKMGMRDAISILKSDGGERRELAVTSDGRELLFTSTHNGKRHIFVISAIDTVNATPARLTDADANHHSPRVSPDGRYVAYLSDLGTFHGTLDLWIYDLKTNDHRRLTRSAKVREFSWKDDSRTIYFSSGVNLLDIHGIDIRDERAGIKKMVTGTGPKDWSETAPNFIRYKNLPKLVYTREYLNGSRRLYWIDTRTRTDEPLFVFGEWDEWSE